MNGKKRFLIVREMNSGKEVHRVEVTGRSERYVERVEIGIQTRMDRDHYFLDDVTEEADAQEAR